MKCFTRLKENEIGIAVCVMAREKNSTNNFKPYYIGTISLNSDKDHKDKLHWYPWQSLTNSTLFDDPEEFFKLSKEIHDYIEKYETDYEIDWSGAITFYAISSKHLVTFNEIKWDW